MSTSGPTVPPSPKNERSTHLEAPRTSANYRAKHLQWKGDALHLFGKGRAVVRIVPDTVWAGMWRIELPNGRLSDMVNRARAKDAAVSLAVAVLNQRGAA